MTHLHRYNQSDRLADIQVIACNYAKPVAAHSKGSLCYVSKLWTLPARKQARVQIVARARSGRWVQRWENLEHLENFRFKTIPKEHPRYQDFRAIPFAAETLLSQIRHVLSDSPTL